MGDPSVVSQIDLLPDGRLVDSSSCRRLGPHRGGRGRYELNRLLKKARLPRWRARAALRRTRKYASRLASHAALHLDLFEQPGRK